MPPKKKPVVKKPKAKKRAISKKQTISQKQSVVVNVNTNPVRSHARRKARQSAPQSLSFANQLRFAHSQPTIAQPTPVKQNEEIAHALKELNIYKQGSIDDVLELRNPIRREANYSLYDELDNRTGILNLADAGQLPKPPSIKIDDNESGVKSTSSISTLGRIQTEMDEIINSPLEEGSNESDSSSSNYSRTTMPENAAPSLFSRLTATTAQMINVSNNPSRPSPVRHRNAKGQFTKKN